MKYKVLAAIFFASISLDASHKAGKKIVTVIDRLKKVLTVIEKENLACTVALISKANIEKDCARMKVLQKKLACKEFAHWHEEHRAQQELVYLQSQLPLSIDFFQRNHLANFALALDEVQDVLQKNKGYVCVRHSQNKQRKQLSALTAYVFELKEQHKNGSKLQ